MVAALVLGTNIERCVGSSPTLGTNSQVAEIGRRNNRLEWPRITQLERYRFESCLDYLGLSKASYREIT